MFVGKTFKKRLIYSNLIIGFLIIGMIVSIFLVRTNRREQSEKANLVHLDVQQTVTYIEREFSKIYETTEALQSTAYNVKNATTLTNKRDYMISFAERIIDDNLNIIGINYIFEPDVIQQDVLFSGNDNYQSDGQFITYISKQYSSLNVEYFENYETYELYNQVVETKDDFFTEPYYKIVENEEVYVSTVVFPVVENGELLGLVGIDFTNEYIFNQLESINKYYDRRDIIVSENGTILVNTESKIDFGSHILTIHDGYLTEIETVDEKGYYIGELSLHGNLEIVESIELGSTGETWYIFSDVSHSVIMSDFYQGIYFLLLIGLGLFILYFVILTVISNSIIEPIHNLSLVVTDFDIKEDDNNQVRTINSKGLTDINNLIHSVSEFIEDVKSGYKLQQKYNFVQEQKIEIQKLIESTSNLQQLYKNILNSVSASLDSTASVLYVKDDNEFVNKVSLGTNRTLKSVYESNDGVIGEVIESQEYKIISHKEFTLPVDSVMDSVNAPSILLYPIIFESETIAIIVFGSFSSYDDRLLNLLDEVSLYIANGIVRYQNMAEIQELYEQTKEQAASLEEQQEELRVSNEELESQQEELRVSNEELESQQEEMEVTNNKLQINLDKIKQMNENLEKAKKELKKRTLEAERANKFKSEFLANMSHELRTPLNSILILSNLIKDNKNDPKKLIEYAETIHSAGNDLLELINGILDLSKVQAGKEDITIKEWTINEDIQSLRNDFESIASNRGVDFKVEMPTKEISIQSDPDKVMTILKNLVSNALKFTKEGHVLLKVKQEESNIEFKVEDTGIGISPEDLDLVFQEFTQVENDNARSYKGTGLGLAICQRYAKLLHGRIHVESIVEEGSTFTLIIPVKNKQTTKKKSKKSSKPDKVRPTNDNVVADDRHNIMATSTMVLVIDDDSKTLQTFREYFNSKEILVIVTDSGENGLFLANYYLPDLIIVDYKLPKMDGEEVIRRIKTDSRTKDIQTVMISGVEESTDEDYPFFQKPITNDTLDKLHTYIPDEQEKTLDILFVEDDELHLRSIVEYVNSKSSEHKFEISTAITKKETLNKLNEKHYSLLVLDLSLPDSKDFELVEEIREISSYKKVPIIVFTGKNFSKKEEDELNELVDDIIIKAQKSPERLVEDIELFLQSHRTKSVYTDKDIFDNKTILIVDDDIRNIFALTGLLESFDINVLHNTSGQDALDRLEDNSDIDLVVMDIMMPKMDGYETMKRIRKMKDIDKLPIVALTAKTMRGDRKKCIEAGATEYLSKPVEDDKLLSVLRVWLQ